MNTFSSKNKSTISRMHISRYLSGFVGVLVVGYVGIMIATVSLIQDRKEIRESIRQTHIAISDLEVHYFELAQAIDTETIKQLGFTESVVPVFAFTDAGYPAVAVSR